MSAALGPVVLCVAGFDPSAGAGLLADIKTLTSIGVYGVGAVSAVTFQHDQKYLGQKWLEADEICQQIVPILEQYEIKALKIGMMPNVEQVGQVIELVRSSFADVSVIWDPVLQATASSQAQLPNPTPQLLVKVLQQVTLLTPNSRELSFFAEGSEPFEQAASIATYCNVLLKGGHLAGAVGCSDYLFRDGRGSELEGELIIGARLHGGGCILSSAIAGHMALGADLLGACQAAKKLIARLLRERVGQLAVHTTNSSPPA